MEISVEVPREYIDEYIQSAIDESLEGRTWNMKQLEMHTNRSAQWLKANVLYPRREELDYLKGGFVRFPDKQGQPWKFGAKRMSEWLEDNLELVL